MSIPVQQRHPPEFLFDVKLTPTLPQPIHNHKPALCSVGILPSRIYQSRDECMVNAIREP